MAKAGTASSRVAAFFDVDGTLAKTTIVHYYAYFRRRRLSPWVGALWQAWYLLKCLYFLILDKVSRDRLNIVFYRGYAGMDARLTKASAADCFRDVIEPRCFRAALKCVAGHLERGEAVVLVTGSVDFIMAPLADTLGVDDVLSPGLVERDGRFTGKLDSAPLANAEKARRIRAYAESHGIDLSESYAYGDSIADLAMLEAVGKPQVVNPDGALARLAQTRSWPIHRWTIEGNE